MKGLALAALAVTLVLSSEAAEAQAQWVGDRGAMAGELVAMSPYFNSPWVEYPIDWAFGEASVSARISMRYRMWKLVGEPVWTFEPRYELEWVKLGSSSIRPDPRLPEGAVQGDLRPDGSTIIRVSEDLFRGIHIRGLHLSARATQPAPDGTTVYHNGWSTAVFDRPGEWGWDVPGSPSWDETFTPQGDPVPEGGEITRWLERGAALDLWSRLDASWKTRRAEPLDRLRCYRLDVSVSSLLARLERVSPGVTRPLFNRMLRGETPEAAEERNAREYQVQALLNGVARELQATEDGATPGSATKALERRLAVTEKAFLLLPDAGPELAQELQRARGRAAGVGLEPAMETLARDVVVWSSTNPGEPLPEEILDGIDQLGVRVRGLSGQLSRATRRRLEALEALGGLGAGLRVVAEWTGPVAGSTPGSVVRLSNRLHAGEGGRAVAVFDRKSPFFKEVLFSDGYDFVDALTGEVLYRQEVDAWPWVFGDARLVLELEAREPGLRGWRCHGAFDLKTRRRVGVPWTGVVRDASSDLGLVLIEPQVGGHQLECWDVESGQRRWSIRALFLPNDYVCFTWDRWVLSINEGVSRVYDAEDASLFFDTTAEPLRSQHAMVASDKYRLLVDEIVRRVGEPSRAPLAFPELPAGYDPGAAHSAWARELDAFLTPAPGTAHSDAGRVRYQLLR